jgi:hypothetical protein
MTATPLLEPADDEANASEQEKETQQPDEEEPPGCFGVCGPAAKVDPRHTSMSIKHLYVPILYLVNVRTDTYVSLSATLTGNMLPAAGRRSTCVDCRQQCCWPEPRCGRCYAGLAVP